MRRALALICAALALSVGAQQARAESPHVNAKLKLGKAAIRKVSVLPALVSYKKIAVLKGVEGGVQESADIAAALYAVVVEELRLRGVEVLPNPLEAAKTDAERYAVADLQNRYDTVAVQLRRHLDLLEKGQTTLDDRVAGFAPANGADAILFIRGEGANRTPYGVWSTAAFRTEMSFVDAKSGEVLAFVRFANSWDVAKKTKTRLGERLREAMRDVPLPAPPPKR